MAGNKIPKLKDWLKGLGSNPAGAKNDSWSMGKAADSGYTAEKKAESQQANRQTVTQFGRNVGNSLNELKSTNEGQRKLAQTAKLTGGANIDNSAEVMKSLQLTFGGANDSAETQYDRTLNSKMGYGRNWGNPRSSVGNAIESGVAGATAGYLNALGTALKSDRRSGLAVDSGKVDAKATGNEWYNRAGSYLQKEADWAQMLSDNAYDRGSRGLNNDQKLLFKGAVAGTQMAGDLALVALTGGSATIPMAVRSFGSGAQQARQAGATENQQIVYGVATAAKEALTEKMFDGVAKLYGAAAADDLVGLAAKKLARSEGGQALVRGLVNMGGEGLEEVVSGLAEPALQSIYNRKSVGENYRDLDMKELWQDGQVGMLLGVLGGNVNIAQTMNGNQRSELSHRGVLNEKFLSAPDRSTVNGTRPITTYSDTLKAVTRSTANSNAMSRGNISNLTDGTQNNSAGTIAPEQNSSYADVLRKIVAEQNMPKVDTDTEIADTPEYDRYRELERKFLNGSIAEHEFDELRKLENVWGQFEVQKGLGKQESDWLIAMGRKTKAMLTGNKAVAFSALPDKMKVGFEERLSSADPDVETALRKICGSAKYKLGTDHRSYYTPAINKDGTFVHEDAITIGINAPPSTIAHELFHKLDRGGNISAELSDGLIQDYIALNVQSGGDIKGYLASNFPDAFTTSRKGSIVVNKDYSSIGDILNGLSGGQVAYGYGHQKSYWAQNGSLEAEAWAGFGRVYYDNNADVIRMFEEIFPNLNEKAKDKLKELI